MPDIFRKTSLDKLSSPEQLDKAITIISPSFWIAAIGGGLIIAAVLIWSIVGRLPVNVGANGIYMGMDSMHSVVAEADGIVEEIYVSEGDSVSAGDKIAQLDDEIYRTELNTLTSRRDDVEAVTFYSYDDPATADTKALLDIKAQAEVSGTALSADQAALRERYRALSKQRSSTSSAQSTMNSAESTVKKKQNEYLALQKNYKEAQEEYSAAETKYTNYLQKLGSSGIGIDVSDPDKIKDILQAVIDDESTPEDVRSLYIQYLNDFSLYRQQWEDALDKLDKTEASVKKKEVEVGNAESKYSQALQTYNTEKSTQKALQDSVSQLEAKVKGDRTGKNNQLSAIEEQFEAAKGSILDQINQEITKLSRTADAMTLTSRVNGKVSGLNIARGNAVAQGTTICKITSAGDDGTGVICYVPVAEGKKIKSGMRVVVYPSTVNKQEYGHMKGSVVSVSDSVVSYEDMQNQLGDPLLVQSFNQNGAVVRVVCDLEKDESTASGYAWSSKKGASVVLEEGTVIKADIVTEEKAPITMLIPYIKDLLTVDNDQNDYYQTEQ